MKKTYEDVQRDGKHYEVFLDGKFVECCIEFDTDKGYVVFYNNNKGRTRFFEELDGPKKEIRFGVVTYRETNEDGIPVEEGEATSNG